MRKLVKIIIIGIVMLIPVGLLSLYTMRAVKNESSKNSGNTANLKFVSLVAIIDEIAQKLEADEIEDANLLITNDLPDPNIPSSQGTPLVVLAAEKGYLDIVAALIQKGADPNKADLNTSETALIKAVRNKDYQMISQVLLPYGSNPNLSTNQGVTPLGIAINLKDKNTADLLVASGAINGISAENLILYAFQKNSVGVETMLSGGVTPNCTDKDNNTPLIIAAANGDLDSVKQLIAYHANVNVKNKVGMTPLLYAVKGKHKEVAEYLINSGAKINASNIYGQNALFWAAYNGDSKLVHNLLMLGANYQKKTRRDQTALQMAKALGHTETVKMLEDYIAYRNLPRDSKGNIILPQVNKAQATQNISGLPAGLVGAGENDISAGVLAGINNAQNTQTPQEGQQPAQAGQQTAQEGQQTPQEGQVQPVPENKTKPAPTVQTPLEQPAQENLTPQATPQATLEQQEKEKQIEKLMQEQVGDDTYVGDPYEEMPEEQPEQQEQQNANTQGQENKATPKEPAKEPAKQQPKTEVNKLKTPSNQPEMPQMPGGMDMSAIMGMMGGQNGQGQQGGAPDMSAIMGMMGGQQNGQGQPGGMPDMSAIMGMMGGQNGQGGNIDLSKMLPPGTQLPEGVKMPENMSMPDVSSIMSGEGGMPDLSKLMPAGVELPNGMDINSIMNMNPDQLKQLGVPEDKIPEITQAKQQMANMQNMQQNLTPEMQKATSGGFQPKDLEKLSQKPNTRMPTEINKLKPSGN